MMVAGYEVHPGLDAVECEVFEQAVAPTVATRTAQRNGNAVSISPAIGLDAVDARKTVDIPAEEHPLAGARLVEAVELGRARSRR